MTRRIVWLTPLILTLGLGAVATWLLATQAGLRWAYAQLQARAPGAIEIETLQGTLAGPITVRHLRYRSDTVSARIESARLDWSPAALLLGRLEIDTFAIEDATVVLPEPDQATPAERRALRFPLNLHLNDVRLQRIRLERPAGPPYTIHALEFSGSAGQQVARIERLRLNADYLTLAANGTIGLTQGTEQELRVEWRITPPDRPTVVGAGRVGGNLADLAVDQRIAEPISARLHARVQPLRDVPTWQATAEIPPFDMSQLAVEGRNAKLGASIAASGAGTEFSVEGESDIEVAGFPPVAASFRTEGKAGGEVVLRELRLRLPDSDLRVHAQARWQPDGGRWQAEARWQELRWPLSGAIQVASPEGRLDAQGTLQRYEFRLEAKTLGPDLPPATWRARGSGDRGSIEIPEIAVDAFATTLTGSAGATWSPALRWHARLAGRDIDPAAAWPEWPGRLSLEARASGSGEQTRLVVHELQGTLRGQKLTANGLAVRRGESYPELSLHLRSGTAAVDLSGGLEAQWQLDWRVQATELGTLLPGASGALQAHGSVTGARATPHVTAQASGTRLGFADARVARAALQLDIHLSDRADSRAVLQAGDVTLFGRSLEQLRVTLDGRVADHTIDLTLQLPQTALEARLRGGYRDEAWRGALRASRLRFADEDWKLVGAPALVVGRETAIVEQACWQAQEASLCLAARRTGADATFDLAVRELPLDLLRAMATDDFELQGTLSGAARADIAAGRLTTAEAGFATTAGAIAVPALDRTRIGFESASVRLDLDASGLRAEARVDLPQADAVHATLALPRWHDAQPFAQHPVEGRLMLRLRDLTPLDAVLLQIDELRGELRADLTLSGTLASPRLSGEAALVEASLAVPAAGVRVRDLRVSATAAGGDELQLNGEARSGDGTLGLSGRVVFPGEPRWRAELRVAGSQFLAADLGESQVYVSPDLRASASPGEIRVTGEVRVPRAAFALRQPQQGVVAVSPDVVIVNAPDVPEPAQRWNIFAEVRVLLGDTVTFRGFGLAGRIAGDVVLIDAPGQATTARGELRVAEGEYEAYGQRLRIERGRLLFVGGPVANPGIDARAVRRIDQVTVGVELRGTLRSPQLTLFSDPAMQQADILSYLVLGRPLESTTSSEGRSLAAAARALQLAGGERLAQRIGASFGIEDVNIETDTTPEAAALVLGKRLSPRLYINYSIGLFQPENVLRLRYQLSPRWSLEAQSGTYSGADLFFTIER